MKLEQILAFLRQLRRLPAVYYIGGSEIAPSAAAARGGGRRGARPVRPVTRGARSTLIEHNLRLVVFLARKFESSGVGTEDLISIGTIGLIKAVSTYRRRQKYQAGNLCVALHRERDPDVSAAKSPKRKSRGLASMSR